MNVFGINIAQVAELDTAVATAGAIRAGEQVADDTFDYIVAVVALIESSAHA